MVHGPWLHGLELKAGSREYSCLVAEGSPSQITLESERVVIFVEQLCYDYISYL